MKRAKKRIASAALWLAFLAIVLTGGCGWEAAYRDGPTGKPRAAIKECTYEPKGPDGKLPPACYPRPRDKTAGISCDNDTCTTTRQDVEIIDSTWNWMIGEIGRMRYQQVRNPEPPATKEEE